MIGPNGHADITLTADALHVNILAKQSDGALGGIA